MSIDSASEGALATIPPDLGTGSNRALTPATLFLTLIVGYFLFRVRLVVELAVLAILYGSVIERPVRALEDRITRRAAILLVNGIIVALLVLPALAFAPAGSREVDNLRANEPVKLRGLEAKWRTSPHVILRGPGVKLIDRAITQIEAPPKSPSGATFDVALRVFKVLIAILVCVTMAFEYLMEKDRLRQRLVEQVSPGSRDRAARLWDACEAAIGGWLRSRIILGVIVGIITTIVFGILRLPYWPLLGILAGLTEPVPIIGPWVGGIPAALLALTSSLLLGVGVVGFILFRQLLVDSVLVPRVTKEAVGLSPLTVFVAVLAGTELLGPPGALLAIPVAAIIQIVIVDYVTVRRGDDVPPDYRWRWLLTRRADQPR
jgi:predicted PurR-regulated permease PerM